MIAIIDYDAGNLKSVEKALAAVGQESVITSTPCSNSNQSRQHLSAKIITRDF